MVMLMIMVVVDCHDDCDASDDGGDGSDKDEARRTELQMGMPLLDATAIMVALLLV